MEFNNQIYRAPSLPKLSRRNISSSVMTGAQIASSPRLKRSTFSFIGGERRGTVGSSLKAETTSLDVNLQETNRILVEIQKQLSLDFANRITEKRQALRASKIKVTRERAGTKEKAIESTRQFGAGFMKVFGAITAPAKSIFQKILDFFSVIVTGLLVNNAFKWLENPANREKIRIFFEFVTKHWKELLALYTGYKILKIVSLLKRITDLFRRPPKPPSGGGGGRGGGTDPKKPRPTDPCGGILQCGGSILKVIKDNAVAIAAALAGALGTYFIPLGKPALAQPAKPSGTKPIVEPFDPSRDFSYYQSRGMSRQEWNRRRLQNISGFEGGTDTLSGIRKEPELSAMIYGTVLSVLAGFGLRGAAARGSFLRGNPNQYPVQAGPLQSRFANLGKGVRNPKRTPQQALEEQLRRHTSDAANGVKLFTSRGGMSLGGTVGGTGSGSVDSVPAMLAPGEEVIRASAAMLFRPLLKDINNNAGRMWTTFSDAIGGLVVSNSNMESALRILAGQLTTFKNQLDQFINDEKLKKAKGGGVGKVQSSKPSMVTPELVLHSDIKQPVKRNAKSSIIPINLPPQTLKTNMPKFSADGGTATQEPNVSSVNAANPYMQIVPEMLGIFV